VNELIEQIFQSANLLPDDIRERFLKIFEQNLALLKHEWRRRVVFEDGSVLVDDAKDDVHLFLVYSQFDVDCLVSDSYSVRDDDYHEYQ